MFPVWKLSRRRGMSPGGPPDWPFQSKQGQFPQNQECKDICDIYTNVYFEQQRPCTNLKADWPYCIKSKHGQYTLSRSRKQVEWEYDAQIMVCMMHTFTQSLVTSHILPDTELPAVGWLVGWWWYRHLLLLLSTDGWVIARGKVMPRLIFPKTTTKNPTKMIQLLAWKCLKTKS